MRLPANARTAVTLARLAGITRICFGTAFIVAPRASARPWVGPGADSAGAQLLTRSMGIRDLLLGAGLLQALNQADHRTAARWLSYGAAAGVIDAGATLAAYPSLPRGGRAFLLFITGALVTDTLLAAQLRGQRHEQNSSPAGGTGRDRQRGVVTGSPTGAPRVTHPGRTERTEPGGRCASLGDRVAGGPTRRVGDHVAHTRDRPSRCVRIAGCGRRARSAVMRASMARLRRPTRARIAGRSARLERTGLKGLFQYRTAGRRAFSLAVSAT
jgi:hypothetical protein